MKRTKEFYFQSHPGWQEREGVSGCTKLDGEDQNYDFRSKVYQQQQRTWIDEQIREKEMIKNTEKECQKAYSTQTHELNRMKGILQDEQKKNHQAVKNSVKEQNLLLAKIKKDKENEEKKMKLQEEQEEIRILMERYKKKSTKKVSDLPKTSILE